MEARKGNAVFLHRPRRLDDLREQNGDPHSVKRVPYIVEATIELDWIDYENFITDLLADRWFLAEYANRCSVETQGGSVVYHCLLVSAKGRSSGVLVLPDGDHVAKAASFMPPSCPWPER